MRPASTFLFRVGGVAVYGILAYFGFAAVLAVLMRIVRKASPEEVKVGVAATAGASTASGS